MAGISFFTVELRHAEMGGGECGGTERKREIV